MFTETIAEADEFRHTADSDPAYNESTYYNFACPTSGVVGWLRTAVQPNQPAAQATALLFLPTGETLCSFTRTRTVPTDTFAVGPIEFRIAEPHRRQELTFSGSTSVLADGRALCDPGAALRDAPTAATTLTLTATGVGASFGSSGHDPATVLEETMSLGHYEQFTRVRGTVTVGHQTFTLDGGGLRDHSWGPRDWAGPLSHRWITAVFEDGSAAMALQVDRRDGVRTRRGATMSAGQVAEVNLEDLSIDWTEDGFARSVRWRQDGQGFTGTARRPEQFVPLRHRRIDEAGAELLTRIGYAPYGFVADDGRRGSGIVEMLDQMTAGR
jgi:hypothetical protein